MPTCPTTNTPCNCRNPKLYAAGLCWNLYRRERGYVAKSYNRSDKTYEASDKGIQRRLRHQRKIKAIRQITGAKTISEAFQNESHLNKLVSAYKNKTPDLEVLWRLLSQQQQSQILRINEE